jgi:hypothetical protein
MKIPGLICASCGGEDLRRSRRQTVFEAVRMAVGLYPFRCLRCESRFWVSVWLFSKLPFAKCPRCLRMQLTVCPEKHFHSTLWRNLLLTFGAHRYRCSACRYNFCSFRPIQSGCKHADKQLDSSSLGKALPLREY